MRLDCKWCGGLGGDWIWHIAVCVKLPEDMYDKFPRAWYPQHPDEALPFFCLLDMPSHSEALLRIVQGDLAVNAFQSVDCSGVSAIRIGQCNTARLAQWSLNKKDH